jgi:hypothetical protein
MVKTQLFSFNLTQIYFSLADLAAAIQSSNDSKLQYLNVDKTLRELMVDRRSSRRLSSIVGFSEFSCKKFILLTKLQANLVRALLERMKSSPNVTIPAASQERFAVIRRLEQDFHEVYESFDLAGQLTSISQSFPVELLPAPAASSLNRRLQVRSHFFSGQFSNQPEFRNLSLRMYMAKIALLKLANLNLYTSVVFLNLELLSPQWTF